MTGMSMPEGMISRESWRCQDCGYVTTNREDIDQHVLAHNAIQEGRYLACWCGHENGSIGIVPDNRTNAQAPYRLVFTCDDCGAMRSFPLKVDLKKGLVPFINDYSGTLSFSNRKVSK